MPIMCANVDEDMSHSYIFKFNYWEFFFLCVCVCMVGVYCSFGNEPRNSISVKNLFTSQLVVKVEVLAMGVSFIILAILM